MDPRYISNLDLKKMSLGKGYTIKKEVRKGFQSHGYNNGSRTDIELEIMVCKKCKKDCMTTNILPELKAISGVCTKCDMEFFVR